MKSRRDIGRELKAAWRRYERACQRFHAATGLDYFESAREMNTAMRMLNKKQDLALSMGIKDVG